MQVCYMSDAGKIRSHNEDSGTIVVNKNNEYLLIVADGMGGHKAGEVASSIAVSHMGERFNSLGSIGTKADAINWIKEIVEEINSKILSYAEKNPNSTGLGTTLVCAMYTKNFLLFGNVGDSRGYVTKNNKLYKVTNDHTLVNLLVETGEISLEEAKSHPKKNVLMKALGASERIDVDIFSVEGPVDGVLLCSDGLTNMLTNEQIEKVLNDEALNCDSKVSKLIKKSNTRGGTDNITIAYMCIESGA